MSRVHEQIYRICERKGQCDMSEYKCCASINGVCHNAYAFYVKCNGFSKECKLRPAYESMQITAQKAVKLIRNAYGIKGDCE